MNVGRALRASCPLEVTELDDGCLGFFLSHCGFLCFQDCRLIRRPPESKGAGFMDDFVTYARCRGVQFRAQRGCVCKIFLADSV